MQSTMNGPLYETFRSNVAPNTDNRCPYFGDFLVGRYRSAIDPTSKECSMHTGCLHVREAISQYTLDKNQPPKSLQDLVEAHYLGAIATHACMQELDSPPVLEDPVSSPNLSTFRLTSVN